MWGIHPGMLMDLALTLPSVRPLEPPLFSQASAAAAGLGVLMPLPAHLPRLLRGWPWGVGGVGWVPPIPPSER